jgi:hypothetical protein
MASNNKQHFATKQETGYADPLGDCNDFNILNFINSSDTPVDSPDLRYCQNVPPNNYNAIDQQQMQQRQPVPSLLQQHNLQRQMHPVILDNGILYNNGATRLPDSPPITGKSIFVNNIVLETKLKTRL